MLLTDKNQQKSTHLTGFIFTTLANTQIYFKILGTSNDFLLCIYLILFYSIYIAFYACLVKHFEGFIGENCYLNQFLLLFFNSF